MQRNLGQDGSTAWCATPTTAASASSRPPSPTANAPHARHRAERHSARQLPPDDQGDHRTRRATRSKASTSCANRNTDYFDIMLLHLQHTADLARRHRTLAGRHPRGAGRRRPLSRGASVHGLPALRQVPGNKWLDVAMIRMNHNGTHMDAEASTRTADRERGRGREHVKQARTAGMGVISMKLVGEGIIQPTKTARRPCASPSGTPASTASPWATKTPRRSTKPSTI